MKWVKRLKVEGQRSLRLLCLFAALSLLGGCSKETAERASLSEPVLSRQYRHGSATAIVSVSETNIPTSGEIILMLDVHAPEHVRVVFPEIEPLIKPFTVADHYTEPVQVLPNGKQLHRRVWILVPALPGQTIFQPLEISVEPATLRTEPISIRVTSLLPPNLEGFEIKGIAAPASLLPQQEKKQRLWKIGLFVGMATLLFTFTFRRARKPKIVDPLPPHKAAFHALENLPGEPLEKIHQLNEILLAFLGDRFNVPTTGQTINEVIPLLPKELLLGRREPLEEFLSSAEQVRFSNHVPLGFAEKYEQYVRDFVEQMKEAAPCD